MCPMNNRESATHPNIPGMSMKIGAGSTAMSTTVTGNTTEAARQMLALISVHVHPK